MILAALKILKTESAKPLFLCCNNLPTILDLSSSFTNIESNIHLLLITSFRVELILFSGSILVLLWLSFMISGGEHALFSIKPSELQDLENKNPRIFKNIEHLIVRPRQLLVLVKLLQMIINVTILFLAAKIGVHLFHGSSLSWLLYSMEIILFIVILLSIQEIFPNYFSGKNNLLWIKFMGTPLYFLSRVFYPFTEIIIRLSHILEKKFERSNEDSEDEVMQKPDEQLVEETDDAHDVPLLKGILKFRSGIVRQVMKSRPDMVAVEENTSYENLLLLLRETRYSRLPVYTATLDAIKGVLYTKDLLLYLHSEENLQWQSLLRHVHFIPEGKKIADLLVELQQQQMHMAIVVDEYGRTAGLVTLEDILEEIIGEIRDETDERIEIDYQQLDDRNYVFEGKTTVSDFCKIMGIEEYFFDDVKSEADSLGGLLLEMMGNIPEPNENIEFGNYIFTVLSLENYRVKKVKVTRKFPVEAANEL
jgi:gliding motility-associated protein GldE